MSVINWIAVFAATAFYDVIWAKYILHVSGKSRGPATLYAAGIILVGGFSTIEFTTNHWMLVPAALGAAVGTWFTVGKT